MSSKTDRNGMNRQQRAWTLAGRLTAFYAGSAFLIVLLATGYLYWAMVRNVDLEDDRLLADRARLLQTIIETQPLDMAAIQQEVDEAWQARQNTHIFIRLLAADAALITESPGMDQLLAPQVFPQATDEPGTGTNLKTSSGGSLRVLSVKASVGDAKSKQWMIQLAMDRSQEDEIIADYLWHLSYVLIVALVVCAGVGYKIAQHGIRPLHEITTTAGRTHSSNLAQRIATTGLPAELQQLAGTFNEMLGRLETAFARLSQFSADIAHELRTPLNNMRGELDVALLKRRSASEYEEIIGSCLEECGRLGRIIDSLLFLARSEDPATQIERERFDLANELANIREFFEATAQEAGVRLSTELSGPLEIEWNRSLFQRAIGNLMTNALGHTPRGGSVTLHAAGDASSVDLEIADTGCGISSEHLPHIFDRFYRADQSREAANGGFGLGLAIVKGIVELHGGSIAVASTVNEGTQVRLHIPRSCRR